MVGLGMLLALWIVQPGPTDTYDLLLKGGHVIDARNAVSGDVERALEAGTLANLPLLVAGAR